MSGHPEYLTLVEAWFGQLTSTEQERVWHWILERPGRRQIDAFAFMPTMLYSDTFHSLPER